MPEPNSIWPDEDPERAPSPAPQSDHEAASAKLWSIYVNEAEKYDKALVASWRSDMDGMLIFAGLFSAALTAFIIESYKSLNVDSGDMTLVLLSQISQQLAAAANGSAISLPASEVFVPSVASIICNALWFTSLGLSLSCALVATLLEQWARDFLHRADMRSSPAIRARVYSYLYYGMKRFNMHTVVEVIPLLLHASLLFFFAGLVAFLLPINTIICGFAATILALMLIIYTSLTILPLFYLDCPYRTPLSGAFWRLRRFLRSILNGQRSGDIRHTPADESGTVVDAIFQRAQEDSLARDCCALAWTVQSLADDSELEPFVETIPDILWGPLGRRRVYDDYIKALVCHPDLQFTMRIDNLLRSADSGLMPKDSARRRHIICLKAIWAICSLTEPGATYYSVFDLSLLSSMLHAATRYGDEHRALWPYLTSALALAQWAQLCALHPQLDHALHLLRRVDLHSPATLNAAVLHCVGPLNHIVPAFRFGSRRVHRYRDNEPFLQALEQLQAVRTDGAFLILIQYLEEQRGGAVPYEYDSTRASLKYPESRLSPPTISVIDHTLLDTFKAWHIQSDGHQFNNVDPEPSNGISDSRQVPRLDQILAFLLTLWTAGNPLGFPWDLCYYIRSRRSKNAVRHVLKNLSTDSFWQHLVMNLNPEGDAGDELQLRSLWYLAFKGNPDDIKLATYELTFNAVINHQASRSPYKPCLAALLKLHILPLRDRLSSKNKHLVFQNASLEDPAAEKSDHLKDDILGQESDSAVVARPDSEVRTLILAELLEWFASHPEIEPTVADLVPGVETLRLLTRTSDLGVAVKSQIRLAKGIAAFLGITGSPDKTFIMAGLLPALGILDEEMLKARSPTGYSTPPLLNCLEDASARQIVKDSLTHFASRYTGSGPQSFSKRMSEGVHEKIVSWGSDFVVPSPIQM